MNSMIWYNHIMEIERKFLVKTLPPDLSRFEAKHITQGYISTDPVIRIRHTSVSAQKAASAASPDHQFTGSAPERTAPSDRYTLTVKGRGLMVREELNLPLTKEAFDRLKAKVEGRVIGKTRYLIPLDQSDLVCELDVFEGALSPLVLAEVEFASEEEAAAFTPPEWFGEDVTGDPRYQNASMAAAAN